MEATEGLPLLKRMRALVASRRYHDVEQELREFAPEDLCKLPSVALELCNALLHLHKTDEGLYLVNALLEARESGQASEILRRIHLLRGSFLSRRGLLSEAQESVEACMQYLVEDEMSDFAAEVNNNLGIILSMRGEWELAVPQYQHALAQYQQVGNKLGVACVCHNIGLASRYLGRCDDAERYFRLAFEFYSTDGIDQELIFAQAERSLAVLGLGDSTLARRMAEHVVGKARLLGSDSLLAETLRVFGTILRTTGRLDEALVALRESFRFATRTNDRQLLAELHVELALVYANQDYRRLSKRHLGRARKQYETMGATGFIRRLELLEHVSTTEIH